MLTVVVVVVVVVVPVRVVVVEVVVVMVVSIVRRLGPGPYIWYYCYNGREGEGLINRYRWYHRYNPTYPLYYKICPTFLLTLLYHISTTLSTPLSAISHFL